MRPPSPPPCLLQLEYRNRFGDAVRSGLPMDDVNAMVKVHCAALVFGLGGGGGGGGAVPLLLHFGLLCCAPRSTNHPPPNPRPLAAPQAATTPTIARAGGFGSAELAAAGEPALAKAASAMGEGPLGMGVAGASFKHDPLRGSASAPLKQQFSNPMAGMPRTSSGNPFAGEVGGVLQKAWGAGCGAAPAAAAGAAWGCGSGEPPGARRSAGGGLAVDCLRCKPPPTRRCPVCPAARRSPPSMSWTTPPARWMARPRRLVAAPAGSSAAAPAPSRGSSQVGQGRGCSGRPLALSGSHYACKASLLIAQWLPPLPGAAAPLQA